MEARTPHWRAAILPVGFVAVCVALLVATWVSFGGRIPLAPQGYRFWLPLPRATGVYEDTSVRIAGITVGRVVSVRRAGAHARALVELKTRFAPVRTGAGAIVRTKTLLGEGYIELAPGPAAAPAVPDGGTLAASHVAPTQQLFDVLRVFDPATRVRVRTMFGGLAAALRGRSAALGGALGHLGPTVESFGDVTSALQAQAPALSGLVSDAGTVLATLGTQTGVIESAVRAGDAALSTTAAASSGLRRTIAALPSFLRQVRSTSGVASGASGDIGAAVHALDTATPGLVPALGAIDRATPVFTELFRRLPAVLTVGERTLPALDRILRAAGASLPQVDTAARQLIPLAGLLSADRNSVVGSLANAAQIQNGVLNVPRLGAVHYAAGAVTVWNETVGGWLRKLPTNRSNPYPAPDTENDIAHGGLRAFDCRNTGNPLVLPPIGSGAPKCLLQGPWTFEGKRAYYPRLQEAPP